MKSTIKYLHKILQSLFIVFMVPALASASSTGQNSFGGEQFVLIEVMQSVIDFASGDFGILCIGGGFVAGGFSILLSRQNDSAGYARMGKVAIGGSIILSALSVSRFFFSGAVV